MATFQFNEQNWQQIWSTSVPSITGIRRLVCPQLLRTQAIALLLSAPQISEDYRWIRAAFINREIRSGLILEGRDATLDRSRILYLNQLQIITYDNLCEFSLIANCVAKGAGLNLFAWEYTG
jgi:hypothetical protein